MSPSLPSAVPCKMAIREQTEGRAFQAEGIDLDLQRSREQRARPARQLALFERTDTRVWNGWIHYCALGSNPGLNG